MEDGVCKEKTVSILMKLHDKKFFDSDSSRSIVASVAGIVKCDYDRIGV
jgi:hypothetical protein